MTMRNAIKRLLYDVGGLGVVGLLVVGCAIQEPPALRDIAQARNAIDAAKQEGAADRFPSEFAELENRYLRTRGVFYACQDDKASEMAQVLATDAAALGAKRMMVAPPPNQAPRAVIVAPAEGEVKQPLQFRSTGSTDPDGDPLTYTWSFGDGATSSAPDPVHAYDKPGNYQARLTVADNRGGSGDAAAFVGIIRRVVLQETKERVLFDFNRSTLKPHTKQLLAVVVKDMKENKQLRAEIVGHTDSTGPAAYNMGLSRRRAEAVRDYLVSQGIAAGDLSLDWKGESQPIASNATQEGRAQNRRVELTIRPVNAP